MSFDFNIEDVQVAATQTQRASVPDGEYLVVITVADKDFLTPKSGQPGMSMEYDIQTGPQAGDKITELFLYDKPDLVKSKIAQIAVAVGMTGGFTAKDVEKLPGKRMIVTLQTKPAKNDPSKMYQNVVKYTHATGVSSAADTKPAAGTLPWQR